MKKDNPEQNIKLITTEDGSHSLYNAEMNETYHSFHGAIQESRHVFVQMGLDDYLANNPDSNEITVLEVGLGTGLNILLVAQWAYINKIKVIVTSIEAYPIDELLIEQLNYTDHIENELADQWFADIHNCPWNQSYMIHEWLEFEKIEAKLEICELPGQYYQIVFFDAFAPNKQSELWEIDILSKVFHSQKRSGTFVTYCAKGQLKRDLRALGYEVETLPGPPGKKEMVRGRIL